MGKLIDFAGFLCLAASWPAFAAEPADSSSGPAAYTIASIADELALLDDERFGGLRRPGVPDIKPPDVPIDEAADEDFAVEASLSLVSDFRRGGISSTAGKPAVQAEFAVEHKSGLFGSFWASNVANNGGADLELDLAVGFAFDLGKVEVELGAIEYIFPGVSNSNYVEFQAGLSKQFGPAKVGVSLAYSPKQNNIGSEDNIYLGASVELPVKDTPVTLNAAAGIEDGAFGDNKIDWSLGASYTINRFELGLTYTDSARTFGTPDSGSRAVFGLKVTF